MSRASLLYPWLSSDKLVKSSFKEDYKESDLQDNDPLQGLIFAADPVTGLPRSDLQIIMSKDSNPEVSQYIRDNYLQSHNSGGTSNPDEALVSCKTQAQDLHSLKRDIVNFIDKNK